MSYQKTLQEWAQEWKQEHLSEDVKKLIAQANFDLWYGSSGLEGEDEEDPYPGFTTATETISDALEDMPSSLYIDEQSDYVSDSEPEGDKCEGCEGMGTYDDEEESKCLDCNGTGYIEPEPYYLVERSDIRAALLGKELAPYIR
jgi:hypothetical protein